MSGSGHLLDQTFADQASDVVADEVDVLLTAATWDVRCLAIAEVQWSGVAPTVVELVYKNRGITGRVDEYAQLLHSTLVDNGVERFQSVPLDSANLVEGWTRLKAVVIALYRESGRPLRIGVDLNSVSRYLWLSLLGYAADTGIVEFLTFVYSAAAAYEYHGEVNIFSEGEWRPRAIATLGNGASPSAESVLVVSSGFEGANTLRLVNALEPDRIMVGLSVGGNIEHEKLSKRNNARLGEQYQLAADVLEFPSINLARSLAVLKNATMNVTRPVHRDLALSFLICGSKLDALAIGLFALDNDVAQIYFSDPERRLETTASAVSWVTAVKVRS